MSPRSRSCQKSFTEEVTRELNSSLSLRRGRRRADKGNRIEGGGRGRGMGTCKGRAGAQNEG